MTWSTPTVPASLPLDTSDDYEQAAEALEAHYDNQRSTEVIQALRRMTRLADNGHIDAAECIAVSGTQTLIHVAPGK